MPRTSIWFNQQQLDQVRDTFGDDANLSGVVRVALGVTLAYAREGDPLALKDTVAVLSRLDGALDDVERTRGRRARDKAEAGVGR